MSDGRTAEALGVLALVVVSVVTMAGGLLLVAQVLWQVRERLVW